MKNNIKKIVKVVSLLVVASIVFSCNFNSTPDLGNDKFKLNGSVNNTNNPNSPYAFTGALNRTDGNPVTGPLPTPIPNPNSMYPRTVEVYNATLFAGSPDGIAGDQNGQGANALFYNPNNMSVDSKNNIYVIGWNGFLKKIDQSGNVSDVFMNTLDGNPLNSQTIGLYPIIATAITFDSVDNMYIASGNKIFKMSDTGNANTIYSFTETGFHPYDHVNASGIALDKIVVDQSQNIYFTTLGDKLIKKVSLVNNQISTVAGQYATYQSTINGGNGNGTNATFNAPKSIISDNNGNFYVSDTNIRKIDSNNNVTTFSGSGWGIVDSDAVNSKYTGTYSMAFDLDNNIILANWTKIRKVDPNGNSKTLIINNSDPNIKKSGYSTAGNFLFAGAVIVNHNGIIYIADTNHNRIIKLTKSNVTIPIPKDNKIYTSNTIAGNGNTSQINGQGINASFVDLRSIKLFTNDNSLFVIDSEKIRKIDSNGNVSDFYSSILRAGIEDLVINNDGSVDTSVGGIFTNLSSNGSLISRDLKSRYNGKYNAMVKDNSNNLYSADISYNVIRKNGIIFAGTEGIQYGDFGFQDGGIGIAKFNNPSGLAIDSSNNIYVSDTNNNAIRKIAPNGNVTTLAGSGMEGFKDGNGTNTQFSQPQGIAVDNLGYVYVADTGNNRIRKIAPNGDVWTIAGSGDFNYGDGIALNAIFNKPIGLTLDLAGNVYVTDNTNKRIRKLTPQ